MVLRTLMEASGVTCIPENSANSVKIVPTVLDNSANSANSAAPSCGTWHRPVEQVFVTAVFVHAFIRSFAFESLTKNDATGGAHMDRPDMELFYGLKHVFYGKRQHIHNKTEINLVRVTLG